MTGVLHANRLFARDGVRPYVEPVRLRVGQMRNEGCQYRDRLRLRTQCPSFQHPAASLTGTIQPQPSPSTIHIRSLPWTPEQLPSLSPVTQANSSQLLQAYTPQAVVLLGFLAPLLDDLGVATERSEATVLGFPYSVGAVTAIVASALLGILVSLSTFLVIGATSSLTYNIVGHAKTVSGKGELGQESAGKRGGGGEGQACGLCSTAPSRARLNLRRGGAR